MLLARDSSSSRLEDRCLLLEDLTVPARDALLWLDSFRSLEDPSKVSSNFLRFSRSACRSDIVRSATLREDGCGDLPVVVVDVIVADGHIITCW